jgi:AbrB family looped-hinge helix DNA binding protein
LNPNQLWPTRAVPDLKLLAILPFGVSLYFLIKCKAMSQATLSAKNQIVIPREAREALRVKAGDTLLVVVRGDKVIVLEAPKSHHAAIRGLGAGAYPRGYLKKERKSWD